jgi:hypothetical protein
MAEIRAAHKRIVARLLTLVALGLLWASALAPGAQAASSFHGTLSLHLTSAHVTAGTPIDASISFSGLPTRTSIVVERQFGTAKVERSVGRYSVPDSGTKNVVLPSVPLGSYKYVAVVEDGKKILARTGPQSLYSYGDVSLTTLCNAPKVETNGGGAVCTPGTVQVGSNLFNYEIMVNETNYQPPQYGTVLNFPRTSCRSLTLTYAASGPDTLASETASVEIVQTSLDPVLSSAPDATLQTFTASLDGGPWDWEYNATISENYYSNYVYYTGSASCWSASGES